MCSPAQGEALRGLISTRRPRPQGARAATTKPGSSVTELDCEAPDRGAYRIEGSTALRMYAGPMH